jgi:N-acyl-D-aspartate/D-glutamate deacylase
MTTTLFFLFVAATLSIGETIEIAERTGVVTVATHAKARGADYWGSSRAAVQLIARARARGVRIFADHYPYNTTGSDGSTRLIPAWVREENETLTWVQALDAVLVDPEKAAALRTDVLHEVNLPSQILGFRNRGLVREGFHADINVLNLDRIEDAATFFEPHRYAEGVVHVLVGGISVVENGQLTWALPGKVITPEEGRKPPALSPAATN